MSNNFAWCPMRGLQRIAAVLLAGATVMAQQLLRPGGESRPLLLSNEPTVERDGHGLDWSKLRVDAYLSGGKIPAAIEYSIFDSLVNAFSYYSWQQQPLWWDPTADVLLTVKRGATNGNQLFYRYSTNRGQSWTQPVLLFDAAATGGQQLPRYPSGYLVNPNNSVTAPEDLLLVFASPIASGTGWIGFRDGFTYLGSSETPQSFFSSGVTIGQYQYTWSTDSRITANAAGDGAYVLGALVAPSGVPTAEQNYIGLRIHDFYAAPTEYVPDEWASTVFADPGQPGYRANVPIGIARDAQGNLVVAVFGRYANSDDPSVPTVGFWSSSDDGTSWSGPNFVQPSAILAYAQGQGMTPGTISIPFGLSTQAGGSVAIPKSFAAYGDGRVSIAFQVFEFDNAKFPFNSDPTAPPALAQLVEASWDGTAWQLRRIADRSFLTLVFDPIEQGQPASTQVGNELQLCVTADGRYLLAKWIEGTIYIAQQDISGDGVAPDTFLTTDVYVAVRELPDGEWSEPLNVTQTPIWDRLAWLPPILPSNLQNIPLLTVKADIDTNTYQTLLSRLVNSQLQLLGKQYVTISRFSIEGVSVRETPQPSAELRVRVAPQPVRGTAVVTVEAPAATTARMELYSVAGARVARLWEGSLSQGLQTLSVPVPAVAAGAYVLRMWTHEGKVVNVPLVVLE